MRVSVPQAILSIVIVVGFVLAGITIALTPVIGGYPVDDYIEYLKTYSSLFSAWVGIVVGYYFGERSAPPDKSTD